MSLPLIEMTQESLARFAIAAAWSPRVELRADPPEGRIAAWIRPACCVPVGLILVLHSEA